jgi:hypothetical protein
MREKLYKIAFYILCFMLGCLTLISLAMPENGKIFAVIIAIISVTFLAILKFDEN